MDAGPPWLGSGPRSYCALISWAIGMDTREIPLDGMSVRIGPPVKVSCNGLGMLDGKNIRSPGRRLGCFSVAQELHRPDVDEKTVDSDVVDAMDMRSASSFSVMVDRNLASIADSFPEISIVELLHLRASSPARYTSPNRQDQRRVQLLFDRKVVLTSYGYPDGPRRMDGNDS